MSEQTLTVSELGVVVRAALEQAMPYGVWVEGEIQGISRSRSGHVYFDLIESAETSGAPPVASMPVVLFRDARDRVNRLLKRHGDPIRMTDGVKIRIQGTVDFYPPNGRLQLRMSAIDPTYTLGVLAAEREALLRRLSESGMLRANARHAVPAVPLRVGVVTSIGSAAHADITTVFERSERAFTLVEVDTAVQGAGAERSIAAAIRAAGEAGVDVVLVVRGGGSKTDLAVFDHADVADAIVHAPIPVFTGIGHDIDHSVADEVAHTAHTTPTAAAQAIVAVVDDWLARLASRETDIAHHTRRALASADDRLERLQRDVVGTTGPRSSALIPVWPTRLPAFVGRRCEQRRVRSPSWTGRSSASDSPPATGFVPPSSRSRRQRLAPMRSTRRSLWLAAGRSPEAPTVVLCDRLPMSVPAPS